MRPLLVPDAYFFDPHVISSARLHHPSIGRRIGRPVQDRPRPRARTFLN
jgi:hypothetical protein